MAVVCVARKEIWDPSLVTTSDSTPFDPTTTSLIDRSRPFYGSGGQLAPNYPALGEFNDPLDGIEIGSPCTLAQLGHAALRNHQKQEADRTRLLANTSNAIRQRFSQHGFAPVNRFGRHTIPHGLVQLEFEDTTGRIAIFPRRIIASRLQPSQGEPAGKTPQFISVNSMVSFLATHPVSPETRPTFTDPNAPALQNFSYSALRNRITAVLPENSRHGRPSRPRLS